MDAAAKKLAETIALLSDDAALLALGAAGSAAGKAAGPSIRQGLGKLRPKPPYRPDRNYPDKWPGLAPNSGNAPKSIKSKLLKEWADSHRAHIDERASVNIIILANGEYSISVSSAVPETLNPLLADLLKGVKKQSLYHGTCGEINNINNFLNAHPEVKTIPQAQKLFAGATTESAYVRANPADPLHGTYQGRCYTCRDVTDTLGIVPQE